MFNIYSISPKKKFYAYEAEKDKSNNWHIIVHFFKDNSLKDFMYLFLERGEGREKERERNIDV